RPAHRCIAYGWCTGGWCADEQAGSIPDCDFENACWCPGGNYATKDVAAVGRRHTRRIHRFRPGGAQRAGSDGCQYPQNSGEQRARLCA
ncbi:MAG: hypothetical protein M3Y49_12330, partial [Actinomycetota bacterium]|nr:hypothetical protein [Actinomycetota bacterium]